MAVSQSSIEPGLSAVFVSLQSVVPAPPARLVKPIVQLPSAGRDESEQRLVAAIVGE